MSTGALRSPGRHRENKSPQGDPETVPMLYKTLRDVRESDTTI